MTSNKKRKHKHKPGPILPDTDRCCTATTGCEWDRSLRSVVTEPIFVQKVYDAKLFNLQALSSVNDVRFSPSLPRDSRVINVLDIRCKRFFNPANIADQRNLVIEPETILSGGEFLRHPNGDYVEVVGPDGLSSERLIYADTSDCDDEDKGTPIFGTQNIKVKGNVVVEIDLLLRDARDRRVTFTVTANIPIAHPNKPIILTNFFELCIPSIKDSAFFPRFAEFCNLNCEARLATNSVARDIRVCPETRNVEIDLIIALCITCEKKIILPVQLCVLSTGFPELSPETSPICTSFPSLFPEQIDETNTRALGEDIEFDSLEDIEGLEVYEDHEDYQDE